MDGAFTHQDERGETQLQLEQQLKICLPLLKPRSARPISLFGIWISKSPRTLVFQSQAGFPLGGLMGTVVSGSVSAGFGEEAGAAMEGLIEKGEVFEEKKTDGFCEDGVEVKTFKDFIEEKGRDSSSSSDFLTSENAGPDEQSHSSSEESSSPPSLGWLVKKDEAPDCTSNGDFRDGNEKTHLDDRKLEKQGSAISEVEMMKEKFAKLLLGEDMSGCGNGVSTALAISNAITNLCATLFGQLWRLEPLRLEKKAMWRREMEWFLSVSDHIVELIPSWQTFPDGSKLEVMTCRPRSDLYINLPALRKLDNMLLEILDSFNDTEFWYVDKGVLASDTDGSPSVGRALQRQEEKWWLPVPRVPPVGIREETRKQLQHTRDCTNQILKAAMAINSITLAEMEVPNSYFQALPKNARTNLGEVIHRYITSDQFSPDCLLACLDLSSEHQALEIANRVEASLYAWRKRTSSKPISNTNRSTSKSSWGVVKDLIIDGDKRELLAERAEGLLLCLKQRFPGLPQTTLDMSKIQSNKDVGKSILESYSRVLESLAYNIVARIDDLFYVDDLTKHSGISILPHKTLSVPYQVPASSTLYRTAFATPSFLPAQLVSPAKGEMRSPFVVSNKLQQCGFGVKKVLTDYLSIQDKERSNDIPVDESRCVSKSNVIGEQSVLQNEEDPFESAKATMSLSSQDSDEEEELSVVEFV